MVAGFGCLELSESGAGTREVPIALRATNTLLVSGRSDLHLVEAGVLRLGRRGDTVAERLGELAVAFAALLDRLQPREVALEEAFAGKSIQSALRIGEARGVVLAESARRGLVVHQYPPARVKRCVTGAGAARKETVAAMLAQQIPGAAAVAAQWPEDATDALAIALARAEERRSPLVQAAAVASALDEGTPLRWRRRR
ncbi:MAG: hypothetical protein RL148_99 [Planctomycetota bacterium]